MARTRTFLAVDIGEAIRRQAQAVQAELAATGANVKWVDPKSFHITLHFLGELDDRDLAQVCKVAMKAAAKVEPFRVSIAGLGAFPNERRPKILWAGVNEGHVELVSLFSVIETPLSDLGIYRKEDRPYSPHLTLGRTVGEEDGALVAPTIAKYRGWTAGMTTIEEVLVMASELRRSGPEYTVIGRAPLRP